ncbi:MAG: alpha-2-macroglobulin family protein [Campylobacterota bacterium]|nr:alpha-2-macroglobulin family protein [Campylobacterota bacterium]
MFKVLLFFFFTLLGFSETLTVTHKTIETDNSIVLKSKDVVFDTRTLYTHKQLVSCMPRVDAIYKVLSSKKLEIMPRVPLASGTRYSCHLDRQFINTGSAKMNDFSFSTVGFGLVDYHYFKNEKLLRMEFNDEVNLKSFKQNVKLYKRNNLATTELQYSISTQDARVILLRVKEAVEGDLELKILSDFKSNLGKKLGKEVVKLLGHTPKVEVVLNAKTKAMSFVDAPRMLAKDNGDFIIRIFFDDTFYNNPLKEFITIDGLEYFTLKKDIYMERAERKEYNITDSYYYVDVMSKDFKPNTEYKMTLHKGLAHYQELKEDKIFTFKTGDRKKNISFNDTEPYVSNLGEIGFSSTNIGKATVIVEKITHENYRYFINYNEGVLKDAGKFTAEVFSKDITLDNPINKKQQQKILLKSLAENTKYGVYKVTIAYEDKDDKGEVLNKSASKVIFVSDIGMSVNLSSDQAFVSLLKLSDGEPIAQAKVELYSINNTLIASATSSEDGVAIIDKTALMGQEPKAIIVSTQDDKSFLLLKKPVNDVSYKALKKQKERYRAFVYFQSNIIRPSGMIHTLITVKDRDFISASKIPVKVILSKLNEETLHEKVYTTDAFGLIDFSYQMQSHDKTGAYLLKIILGDKVIGKKIIDVEAFMPPKIENKIKTDKTDYMSDEFVQANISSEYLFGAPSSFLRGKVSYTATAFDYTNLSYKDYSFTNKNLDNNNELLYINVVQDISLNSEGKASLLLPCKTQQKVPSVLKAMIGATIMDDTQPVSTYKEIVIYPYKTLVGVKLEHSNIVSGENLVAKTVLLDPMNNELIQRDLTVIVKKIDWHYSYSNGHYNWEKQTSVVDTFTVPSNEKFSREMAENGDFLIEVHDRLEKHSASMGLEVSGWGYTNISPKDNLKKVEIRFEERLYKKGESIKVSLKSPILEGRVLLTLEGERVLWHKSIKIDKGVAEVEVPLAYELKRGVYLHATATRKTDTKATIIPFRAMGYAFVKPNRNRQQIVVDMEFKKVSPSKSIVPLSIKTDRDTALLVSVVDSGILGITEQKPPRIFDYFNQKPDKKLLYFDLYDEVMQYLTEGNIVAFGAGDMESLQKRKKHLAPENIDRVKPFMLWSNIIHTKNKEAIVELDIPEFNGKATIVVMALNQNSIGVRGEDIVIKDDIMIKPSYPRFLLKGDSVEVPVRVFNTTNKEQTVTLQSDISVHFSLVLSREPVVVAANSSTVVKAKLKALNEGQGSIELSTTLKGKTFAKSVELAVLSPYALQTQTFQDATSSKKRIDIPKKFRNSKVLVSLSDNLLGQLRGDLKYLISYPYGCAEQTSSKIAAMFYSKPFMKDDALVGDADNFIRQGVKKLSRLQNWHGEFSYWEEGGYVEQYASIYASQILLELDQAGYSLDSDIKRNILKALKNIVNGKKLSVKYGTNNRLYAAYILSVYGKLDLSTANMLYDKKLHEKYYFSWFYMATIFKNLHQDDLADKIYAGVSQIRLSHIKKLNYRSMDIDHFTSKSRDMFLFFYLNSKYFEKNREDFNLAKKQLSKLYSTHEKAMAFKAMSSYIGNRVHDKMKVALKLNGEITEYENSVAFIRDLSENKIDIEPLSGVVNYSIELYKPLPRELKNELSSSKDLSIKREFIDVDGKEIELNNLEQGSKIYSKVTVANYPKMKNVVLSQRIPACMDIVNSRISKSSNTPFKDQNLLLDYKDIRDDRVLHFIHLDEEKVSEIVAGSKKKKTRLVQSKTVIYTPLIVTTIGECKLPAITIEKMYDSRVNDYAKQVKSVVVKSKEEIVKNQNLKPKNSLQTEVKDMVRKYYRLEAMSSNENVFLPYFKYPVKKYFNKVNATKAYILEDKKHYNHDWIEKEYDIYSIDVIASNEQMQTYSVKIIFHYKLTNKKGKSMKGISKHLLSVKNSNGKLYIEKIELFK